MPDNTYTMPDPFRWSPDLKEVTILGYTKHPIKIPADPIWWPMVKTAYPATAEQLKEHEAMMRASGHAGSCHVSNTLNQMRHYGADPAATVEELRQSGYTDASLLYLAGLASQLGHFRCGSDEVVWPEWISVLVPFSEQAKPGTWSCRGAEYFLCDNAPAMMATAIEFGKMNEINGNAQWLATVPFTKDVLNSLLQNEDNFARIRDFLLDLRKHLRIPAPVEWSVMAEALLLSVGWETESRSGTTIHVMFGSLTVHNLPRCSKERLEITLADIVDREGKLYPASLAIEKLIETYGDLGESVPHPNVPEMKLSTELSDWLKDAHALKVTTGCPAGSWRYLPDILEQMNMDVTQINDIAHHDSWYTVGKTEYSLVEFKEGSTGYTVVMTTGKKAPDCDKQQDIEKLRAVRRTDQIMLKLAAEQMINGFDDCYGACWLKDALGVEADRISSSYEDLKPGMQADYAEWCEQAVSADGWAHQVSSYDGCGYTDAVVTWTAKPTAIIGFAYWRS